MLIESKIKNYIYKDKSLNPLKGMLELFWVIPIFLLTLALSMYFYGLIFSSLAVVVLIFISLRLYIRVGSKWRRLHFPLTIHYYKLLSAFVIASEQNNEKFEIRDVYNDLVALVFPKWSDKQIIYLLNKAYENKERFVDAELFWTYLKRRESALVNKFGDIRSALIDPENTGFAYMFVIAELVSEKYGMEEKLKYIYAFLTNRATFNQSHRNPT